MYIFMLRSKMYNRLDFFIEKKNYFYLLLYFEKSLSSNTKQIEEN